MNFTESIDMYTTTDIVTGDMIIEVAWVRLRIPRRLLMVWHPSELEERVRTGIEVGMSHPELGHNTLGVMNFKLP